MGVMFQINEADGAFYGPKIDISVSDALNRKFQCATLQVNLLLPCISFFFPDFVRASLVTIIYYWLEKSFFNLLMLLDITVGLPTSFSFQLIILCRR